MKERPIIVCTQLIPRVLDGSMTMTRRVIKPQPKSWAELWYVWYGNKEYREGVKFSHKNKTPKNVLSRCPYGQVGDRLWVREKALYWDGGAAGISAVVYQDDPEIPDLLKDNNALFVARTTTNIAAGENIVGKWVWKPSIHMYKEDSRITLEITGIRVERLQEIKRRDCIAEGLQPNTWSIGKDRMIPKTAFELREQFPYGFKHLWNSLNAKRGHPWENNDWVWVISFKLRREDE